MADDNNNKIFNEPNQNILPDNSPEQEQAYAQPQQAENAQPQTPPDFQTPPQPEYQAPPQQNYQAPPQQQYYNPQQNYQQGAPNQQFYPPYPQQPQEQKASVGFAILSYLVPLAGLIIYLTQKDKRPKTAKASGICALVSFIINCIVLPIIMYAVMGAAMFSVMSDEDLYSYDDYSSYNDDFYDYDDSYDDTYFDY